MMNKTFCGYVSILGKPNVGKSTLLNKILNKKVSITSRKSQTTRNNILGIKTSKNMQAVFIDSPGIHGSAGRIMNKVLNKSALGLIEDSDLIIFMTHRLQLDAQDEFILRKLKESNAKVICAINKVDQIKSQNQLLPFIDQIKDKFGFLEILPISAKYGDGLDDLEKVINSHLPESPFMYEEESIIPNAHYENFFITETIREKIIRSLGDELPHDTFVEIEQLEEKEDLYKIHAVIYVSRESQKQIVIGDKGNKLKQIGIQARKDLEKYFEKKVFLKTWVKVRKNWNNDNDYLKSLGVGGTYESK